MSLIDELLGKQKDIESQLDAIQPTYSRLIEELKVTKAGIAVLTGTPTKGSRGKWKDEDIMRAITLRNTGLTWKQVANEMNCPWKAMYLAYHRYLERQA